MKLTQEAEDFLQKNRNKKLVFTNGCFDILHVGHVRYLEQARALGDLLFIGLNSDSSVKQLKGPGRPINSQSDRLIILKALRFVDFIEIFDSQTPKELIEKVDPQVLVKGGDYQIEKIVGYDWVTSRGGLVTTLPFVPGKSTTQTLAKLRGE